MSNSAWNGEINFGRRWLFLAIAAVPSPFLYSYTLFIPMHLIIPKQNLGTLLWRLLLQHSKNDRIRPLPYFEYITTFDFICNVFEIECYNNPRHFLQNWSRIPFWFIQNGLGFMMKPSKNFLNLIFGLTVWVIPDLFRLPLLF